MQNAISENKSVLCIVLNYKLSNGEKKKLEAMLFNGFKGERWLFVLLTLMD
jgi:hypothetical protein